MNTMNTRGVKVNAHADPVNKGKTLFPWRDPLKGQLCKTILIKHVLVSNLHLGDGSKGVKEKWDALLDSLKKEPQFAQYLEESSVPLSGQSLRSQFQTILEERKNFHGWNGGSVGNNSGREGDIDELDSNIRQILMDLEEKEEKKKMAEELKKDLDQKEAGIISGAVQEQVMKSKSKRKAEQMSSSGESSGEPSPSDAFLNFNDLIFKPSAKAFGPPPSSAILDSSIKPLSFHHSKLSKSKS